MSGEVSVLHEGLTLIVDLERNPDDGTLLALQLGRFGMEGGFQPFTGNLMRLGEGTVDTLLTAMMLPSGMHITAEGDLFVASLVGTVTKMSLSQTTSVEPLDEIASSFRLEPNFPNPFQRETEIRFALEEASLVNLKVFDLMGREVATLVDGSLPAGAYRVVWDGSRSPSGMYFYRLQAGGRTQSRTMVLTK